MLCERMVSLCRECVAPCSGACDRHLKGQIMADKLHFFEQLLDLIYKLGWLIPFRRPFSGQSLSGAQNFSETGAASRRPPGDQWSFLETSRRSAEISPEPSEDYKRARVRPVGELIFGD